MKRIEIRVYIPASLALGAGSTVFGEALVTPSEQQLLELSNPEIEALSHYLENDAVLTINSAVPTWGAVRDAITILAGMR